MKDLSNVACVSFQVNKGTNEIIMRYYKKYEIKKSLTMCQECKNV